MKNVIDGFPPRDPTFLHFLRDFHRCCLQILCNTSPVKMDFWLRTSPLKCHFYMLRGLQMSEWLDITICKQFYRTGYYLAIVDFTCRLKSPKQYLLLLSIITGEKHCGHLMDFSLEISFLWSRSQHVDLENGMSVQNIFERKTCK